MASVHEIKQLEMKKEREREKRKNCRSGNRIGFCSYFSGLSRNNFTRCFATSRYNYLLFHRYRKKQLRIGSFPRDFCSLLSSTAGTNRLK